MSRYWIGAYPEFIRFPGGRDTPALLARMGMDGDSMERLAYDMAVHDLTEFADLAHPARRSCGVRKGVIMACAAPLPHD